MSKINREAELAVRLYRQWQREQSGDFEAGTKLAVTDAARLCSLARALRRAFDNQYAFGELTPEVQRIRKLQSGIETLAYSYGVQASTSREGIKLLFPDAEVTL